ncbi:MAG: cytochrome c family protein [Planctomycetes bacterium]|nr:cytochrome c family protein [Planctomycetota bacterium]
MPQFFHRRWSTLSRLVFYGAPLYLAALAWMAAASFTSPFAVGTNIAVDQPIPFSHEHHAGRLKIDCRYCHETVEQAAFAGMPSTEVCLHCHTEVWTGHQAVKPILASRDTQVPLAWRRVHDLPDFACFDHSIHVQTGVGCVTCHGRVDQMPQVWKTETMTMQWCLECHRAPQGRLRPREEVFSMTWRAPTDPAELAELAETLQLEDVPESSVELQTALVELYDIQSYTSCSNCHQ